MAGGERGRKKRTGRPPGREMDARLAMRVPSELMERLQEAARRDERTVPQLVRLILRRALDESGKAR